MPITPPSLDDRRFDDLVNELIARIPAHTPEWTNPRQGDPGRTLIELFAWLTDTLLYRANLIPERQRLVFLKLLGQALRPAQPATGIVSLSFAQPTQTSAITLAPGAKVKGPQSFETLTETTVLPISAEAYYKRALSSSEQTRMGEVLTGLASVHRAAVGNGAVRGYQTTAVFDAGRAEADGVDVIAQSVDRALWLALLAPRAPQPAQQGAVNTAARKALGAGASGAPALLSVGVVPVLTLPALFEEIGARAQVPVIWELTTRGASGAQSDYLTLEPLPGSDGSNGLSQPGTLRLPLPHESQIWAPDNDVGNNPAAGVGDNPPRLDDPAKAARLLAWLRLRPKPGEQVGRLALSWIGVNAAAVDQRVTLSGRVLGASTGAADQRFPLPQGSVDAATLQIQVEEPGTGYQNWYRVDDLAALGDAATMREARAYELDAEAGTLRFGDGVRGRVPEAQMRVRLAYGRFGGGTAGNLPAGSLGEVTGTVVGGGAQPAIKSWQPLATDGGADAETLDAAERRIPSLLRHRDRAVTVEDYRALAQTTPGIDVGRVEVLPQFKPHDRRFGMRGVVSVMALPAQALTGSSQPVPNPRPDRPFIERLHAYLSARTPLATELYVIGCEYVALGVSVAIVIADGFGRDAVLFEVRETLRRALWPLAPGGAAGTGWPLGRAVQARELLVDVARVAGVLEVSGVNLFRRNADGTDWQRLLPGGDGDTQLPLQPWQLPELLSVVVVEGSSSASVPTNLHAVANPFADRNAVAVPVVPETC